MQHQHLVSIKHDIRIYRKINAIYTDFDMKSSYRTTWKDFVILSLPTKSPSVGVYNCKNATAGRVLHFEQFFVYKKLCL